MKTYNIVLSPLWITILFIILKLYGIIQWSWFWVTCPIWIPSAIALVIGLFVLFIFLLAMLILMAGFAGMMMYFVKHVELFKKLAERKHEKTNIRE